MDKGEFIPTEEQMLEQLKLREMHKKGGRRFVPAEELSSVSQDELSPKKARVWNILNRYTHRVLRAIAREHLPKDGRLVDMGGVHFYRNYLVFRAPKYKLVDVLLKYVDESIESECEEVKIYFSLKERLKESHNGRNSEARRKAHKSYEQRVVNPRRKAIRHYILDHPEMIAQIKEKHDLA